MEHEHEHEHGKSGNSRPRMNSRYPELSEATRQDNLSFSAFSLREPHTSNAETKEILPLVNGYTNHDSDREDSSSQDENRHRDDDSDEIDDNDNVSLEIKYNNDEECDNGNDNFNDDDDAVEEDNNGDDDNNKDGNDDDDDDDDDRTQDADASLLSDRVNELLTIESNFSSPVCSGNDDQTSSTKNIVNGSNNNNSNISSSSSSGISSVNAQSRNKEKSSSSSSNNDDYAQRLAADGTPFCTNKINFPIGPAAGNLTSQGARPKTSSGGVLGNVDNAGYYSGKIPSLEVTGIKQGFLARHTTDQSLPYNSYTGDDGLPTSEPTSFINWPQTSITSNDSCTTPCGLLCPPDPETSGLVQEDFYFRRVHPQYRDPSHAGYQPVATMTGLSGWQSPNQHQLHPGGTAPYFPLEHSRSYLPDPWFTRYGQSTHLNTSGHFPGTIGTQGGNSFNRQAWMPSDYETAWPWQRYDYNGYHPNFGDFAARNEPALNSSAVNPPAPAITLSGVTLPNADVRFQSTTVRPPLTPSNSSSTMSAGVASNRLPPNAYSSNRQELVGDFSTNSSFASEQQGNHDLPSSETTSSRRQQESFRNNDSLNLSQEGLQTWAPSQDDSLVALERKVAEACAVVERVLKEREERTKRQREALQRQREIRQQREREARERREREEQERRERAEREAREREDTAVEESPLWQCEHYQRRCRVRFPCCGVFYPCHRCHNGSGACDADDKKAKQATHVKCANCGHEEEINEGSQNCSNCAAKLSEYFCFKCKHFTGVDKNPFHCNKCGICRIYKDRSFHCDVCNVCLDKRLEGKHKCRPDSGHDECCICLEDAFSGCQILPCSHKVHRECAIAMIQNGVRSCPICRHPLYSQGSQ